MPTPPLRERVLQAVAASRDREAALAAACDDRPPAAAGTWTAKDHLAHLASWRDHATAVLRASRSGTPGPPHEDTDKANARHYAAHSDRTAAAIVEEALATYAELEGELAAGPEAVLLQPRPGRPDLATWTVVVANGHQHLAEHLSQLDLERGDEAAAEAAQLWAFAIDQALAAPEPPAASNVYNLACFYARIPRPAAAIPLLREAFGSDPALRAWAAKDSDLDPIRELDELRDLITGPPAPPAVDPLAGFRAAVAASRAADPMTTFANLSRETGIPVDDLVHHALHRWAAAGAEALMALDPMALRDLVEARRRQDWVKVAGIIDWLEAGNGSTG